MCTSKAMTMREHFLGGLLYGQSTNATVQNTLDMFLHLKEEEKPT
jgi:hypothetical protein